jgi:serine/threonine protein kinase
MSRSGLMNLDGPAAQAEEEFPASFGKYRPFATLGSGGMAQIYLAVAQGVLGVNKLAVIKRLRPTLVAEDEEFVKMFVDEARLASRLNHPNIVHTYEIGEQDGGFFIAMEYLDGQPLDRVMKSCQVRGEPLDPAIATLIIMDALAGLHDAHELRDYDGTPLGIIHRDVSPQNIFVTYEGSTKIVDFGVAKAVNNETKTESGVLKGKIGYMALEQAAGSFDRRADIFSVGVVLWELLSGKRMFTGASIGMLHRLVEAPIPSVLTVNPKIDDALAEIVSKATQKEARDRYETAEEMRAALEVWGRGHGIATTRDVGKVLAEMFAAKRVEFQRRIEAQMQNLNEGVPISRALPSLEPSSRFTLPAASQSGVKSAFNAVVAAPPPDSVTPASGIGAFAPRKRRTWLFIAAGAIPLLLLGVFAARPPTPAVSPVVATTATPTGMTTRAVVVIRSDPPGAIVEWEGRIGATPLTLDMPAGKHHVAVATSGFEATSFDVDVPEGATTVPVPVVKLVAMKPATTATASAPAAAAPVPFRGFAPARPARPAPAVSVAPKASTPTAVAPVAAAPEPAATPRRTNVQVIDDPTTGRPKVGILQ